MAQYVVSSVIQGLLGRQPDMMGSWGTYCSLNLMYLPGAGAGGDQGRRVPSPTTCLPCPAPGRLGGCCRASSGPGHVLGLRGALGSATTTAAAAHPSRQMDDFTRVLAMAFLQYSIWGRPTGHVKALRPLSHPLSHLLAPLTSRL